MGTYSIYAEMTSNPQEKYSGDIVIPSTVDYESKTYEVRSIESDILIGAPHRPPPHMPPTPEARLHTTASGVLRIHARTQATATTASHKSQR